MLWAVNTTPTPVYTDLEQLPTILAQRRLANVRKKQLIKAASRAHDEPPPPPKPDECCGSSCDPCVKTLWKEELACWRERWGAAAEEKGRATAKVENEGANNKTMPGGFDW